MVYEVGAEPRGHSGLDPSGGKKRYAISSHLHMLGGQLPRNHFHKKSQKNVVPECKEQEGNFKLFGS